MSGFLKKFAPYRKAIFYVIGAGLSLATFYWADNPWVAIAVAAAGLAGVYVAPNDPKPSPVPPPRPLPLPPRAGPQPPVEVGGDGGEGA